MGNPDIFTNSDTCYVLSFAIIMLNTSLHNPSVRDKPSVDQFVSMNRGINDGGDLPRELLVSLYESIKTEPFKIPEDDGNDLMHTFFNPDREGWLWKQGGRYKSWKRRWFILNDNCLYYFEFTTDKEPRGIIPLVNIKIREVADRSKQHCFELFCSGNEVIKACKTDSEWKGSIQCIGCLPQPRRRRRTGSSASSKVLVTILSTTCWRSGRRRYRGRPAAARYFPMTSC